MVYVQTVQQEHHHLLEDRVSNVLMGNILQQEDCALHVRVVLLLLLLIQNVFLVLDKFALVQLDN